MAKYRPVDQRIWSDRKFLSLSDDGRMLWLFLLTTSFTKPIPGVIVASEVALADELGWTLKRYQIGYAELVAKGFAVAREGKLLWLKNGLKYQSVAGPKAIIGMSKIWDDIPESNLKHELWQSLKIACKTWDKLFAKGFPEPIRYPIPRGFTQDQDQEHDQEHEHDQEENPRVPRGTARQLTTQLDSLSSTRQVTDAFESYFATAANGAKPTWNGKTGKQLKGLLGRHPVEEIIRRIGVLTTSPPKFPPMPWDFLTFASRFDQVAAPSRQAVGNDTRAGDLLGWQLQRVREAEEAERHDLLEEKAL